MESDQERRWQGQVGTDRKTQSHGPTGFVHPVPCKTCRSNYRLCTQWMRSWFSDVLWRRRQVSGSEQRWCRGELPKGSVLYIHVYFLKVTRVCCMIRNNTGCALHNGEHERPRCQHWVRKITCQICRENNTATPSHNHTTSTVVRLDFPPCRQVNLVVVRPLR